MAKYRITHDSFVEVGENELMHKAMPWGKPRDEHKYISRKWRNGRWVYTYEENGKMVEKPKPVIKPKTTEEPKTILEKIIRKKNEILDKLSPELGDFRKKQDQATLKVLEDTAEKIYNAERYVEAASEWLDSRIDYPIGDLITGNTSPKSWEESKKAVDKKHYYESEEEFTNPLTKLTPEYREKAAKNKEERDKFKYEYSTK